MRSPPSGLSLVTAMPFFFSDPAIAPRTLWDCQPRDLPSCAIVAPTGAVQNGQQGTYAFVVKSDATVESRPVTVARNAADGVVIAKGLAAGETVVTDGQLRLSPGAKIEVVTAEGAAAKKS